ncbi:MAG: rhodanese-like domain-containing protein [Magnetococcales bacterium]|nr:rhodanese-like domain-containing protein [Magnetococcales bacterium]
MNTPPHAQVEELLEKALEQEMISTGQLMSVVSAELAGVILLDIRTPTEFAEGIIRSSHLFPCDHNLVNREDVSLFRACFDKKFDPGQFDPDLRYVLICRSGPRTEIATERFVACGLRACELVGGIEEWKRQGFPLVAATRAPLYPPDQATPHPPIRAGDRLPEPDRGHP